MSEYRSRGPIWSIVLLGAAFALAFPGHSKAQTTGQTTIGGTWYLSYRVGKEGGETFNRFGIDRGYINIRHRLTDRWSGRITPDVTLDDFGDAKVRLKYAYGDVKLDDAGFLTSPHIEFGISHRPWLDYEEHISLYRNQGTMFMERAHLFNSADYGFTFFSLLGGEVDEEYQETVTSAYPGRWGSVAVGLYNGGGYHAKEANENKSLEARLSIRPFPDAAPGLQISYLGMFGKGNTEESPDFTVNTVFASYETRDVVLTAQRYFGEGDSRGRFVDDDGVAVEQDGTSLFAEWKLHGPGMSIIGRYDTFNSDAEDGDSDRFIAGVAYHIKGHSKILMDLDIESPDGFDTIDSRVLKLGLEFNF
ncbi:hypothetical protein ACFL3S_07300 [Gemmatimonadota bacterium]